MRTRTAMTAPLHLEPFVKYGLFAAIAYYFLCGISAIAYPESWIMASGLGNSISPDGALSLGILGSQYLALALAGCIALRIPGARQGVMQVYFFSNVLDLLTNILITSTGRIGFWNGVVFSAISRAWCLYFGSSLRRLSPKPEE